MGSASPGSVTKKEGPKERSPTPTWSPVQFSSPLDIPVKQQMEYILTHWLRNYGQGFPNEIIQLFVDRFVYQPVFALEHRHKLNHSDKFFEEFAAHYTKRDPPLEYDYLFKLFVAGNRGVGKTSLIARHTNTDSHGKELDFVTKIITIKARTIKLQIWDIRNERMNRSHYTRTSGVISLYSVTDHDSWYEMSRWNKYCKEFAPELVVKMLIGNKVDAEQKRLISTEKGQELASHLGAMNHIEISVKTGQHVERAINTLVLRILHRIMRAETPWIG